MVLKRRVCVVLILMALVSCATRASGETAVGEYIRLHVVTEDDGAAAQALKLKVRDACLEAARALLMDCDDADEAWRRINDNLETLSAAAEARARALGYAGEVEAQLGVFDFPDRRYGALFVPAGRYRALRVVLGSGEGRNWWCVLFPSLCLPQGVEPGAPIRFHSTVWDWVRGVLEAER